jgi:hypothetical protein
VKIYAAFLRFWEPEEAGGRAHPRRRWLPEWEAGAYPDPMIDLAQEAAEAKVRYQASRARLSV